MIYLLLRIAALFVTYYYFDWSGVALVVSGTLFLMFINELERRWP